MLWSVKYFVVLEQQVNAEKVAVSGKKRTQKLYRRHSGRPGGMKVETFDQLQQRIPERIIEHAVRGMLPKGRVSHHLNPFIFFFYNRYACYKCECKVPSFFKQICDWTGKLRARIVTFLSRYVMVFGVFYVLLIVSLSDFCNCTLYKSPILHHFSVSYLLQLTRYSHWITYFLCHETH